MISKTTSTRVQAPTFKSDVENAFSGCKTRIDDVSQETLLEPCETNEQNNKSGKYKNGLAKCHNVITIGTLNVRTIQSESKRLELAHLFNLTKQSIVGIIDHKIVHENELIKTQYLDGCALITTSAWRNSNGAASGGIGLIVQRKIEQNLAEIVPINKRILIAHFNGNPMTTVIVHYSPVEGSAEAAEHYTQLANTIQEMRRQNTHITIGPIQMVNYCWS